MDAAGLLLGMLAAPPSALAWLAPWLGDRDAALVMAAVSALLAAAVGAMLLRWRRRRQPAAKAVAQPDPAEALKACLRRRLSEHPAAVFAPLAGTGPTVGASEVVERDLDAAAKAVLPEAQWRRSRAKHVLRRSLNGHAASGGPAAGEAARWRQLGALALIDDADDALIAYSRAADLAPDDADLKLLVGLLYLRTGRLEVAEATFRRLLEAAADPDAPETVGAGSKGDAEAAAGGNPGAEAVAEDRTAAETPASEGKASTEPADAATDSAEATSSPESKPDPEAAKRAAIRFRAGTMLGDVLVARSAREAALAVYTSACTEVLALAEGKPGNPRWRRDASVAHDRIGDLLLADGQGAAALDHFRKSLEMNKALAAAEPVNAVRQHDLSVAYDRVGEVKALLGDLDGALESYRDGLALAEMAARLAPRCSDWRWDISASHDRIGDVLSARGKLSDALAAYRVGLGIAEALAAVEPARLDWQRDLAASCHKIGLLEAQLGREAEAREVLEQGRAIIARLAEIARYRAQWRADLACFNAALKGLGEGQ